MAANFSCGPIVLALRFPPLVTRPQPGLDAALSTIRENNQSTHFSLLRTIHGICVPSLAFDALPIAFGAGSVDL